MAGKPWALICSRQFLTNDRAGSSTYILSIGAYLRKSGYRLAFVAVSPTGFGVRTFARLSPQIDIFDDYRLNRWTRFGRFVIRTDSLRPWLSVVAKAAARVLLKSGGLPLPTRVGARLRAFAERDWHEPLASPDELSFAAIHLARLKPKILIVNYYYLADILNLPEAMLSSRYIITHAIMSERNSKLAQYSLFHDDVPLAIEIANLMKADRIVAIQARDAGFFREHLPPEKVILAPMAVPLRPLPGPQVKGRCLFVGSLAQANTIGLQWFLSQVWPKVMSREPAAHLHVVGSVGKTLRQRGPKVVVRGQVDQLSKEYSETMVFVVPLVVGSGLKIKLIEAISHGRTGVTTSVGAEGVETILDGAVAIEDDADAFAQRVLELLTDDRRRRKMEAAALACTKRYFNDDVCYGDLLIGSR
jgi:glycosyltransferase involved in cell wall biosynthesis